MFRKAAMICSHPPGERPSAPACGSSPSTSSILQTAFHWVTLDNAVISFRDFANSESQDVVNSLRSAFPNPGTAPLRAFQRLPPELLHIIYLQLDMASVFKLRHSDRKIREIIGAMSEYKAIVNTSLACFRAMLRTHTASRVSLSDFYRTLCTRSCELCHGQFGHLVYLPTWKRFCWGCMRDRDPRVMTVDVRSVAQVLGLEISPALRQTSLRSIPGIYGLSSKVFEQSAELVPLHLVEPIYSQEKGRPLDTDVLFPAPLESFQYMATCVLPAYDQRSGQVDLGVSCEGCHRRPSFGAPRHTWDVVYSKDGFLQHFESCQKAQDLWEHRNVGLEHCSAR